MCAFKSIVDFQFNWIAIKAFSRGKKRADVKMFSLTNFELKSIKQQFKNSSIVNFKTICEFAFSVQWVFVMRVVGGEGRKSIRSFSSRNCLYCSLISN